MRMRILSLSAIFMVTLALMPGQASSHREAPLTSQDPMADNTDVYAFVSPDAPDTVTLIANFIPFQKPDGGPNFYSFDPNVVYEIHIAPLRGDDGRAIGAVAVARDITVLREAQRSLEERAALTGDMSERALVRGHRFTADAFERHDGAAAVDVMCRHLVRTEHILGGLRREA